MAIGIAIGALFLGYALEGVPFDELGTALARIDAASLAAVAGLTLLQQVFRTWRQALLLEPIAPGIPARQHLLIFQLGFLGIAVLPARLGEVVRPLMLQRRHGLPLSGGLGFVVAERMLDVIVLLAALIFALDRVDAEAPAGEFVLGLRPLMLAGFVAAVVGLVVAIWWGERLTGRWIRPERGRVWAALANFVSTLSVLRSLPRLLGGLALSAAHFACMAFSVSYVADALGFGAEIGVVESLGVLCLTMIGLALPAPPGQIGVFEGSVVAALTLFGVPPEQGALALAFALVVHWWPLAVHAAATALLAGWQRDDTRGLFVEIRSASEQSEDEAGSPQPSVSN
jgi:hypothetical protein